MEDHSSAFLTPECSRKPAANEINKDMCEQRYITSIRVILLLSGHQRKINKMQRERLMQLQSLNIPVGHQSPVLTWKAGETTTVLEPALCGRPSGYELLSQPTVGTVSAVL